MQSIIKAVLSPDQISLTVKQRDRYNQLVQQGIEPKVARQLAIALTKSGKPPLGAAYSRAARLQRERGGDEHTKRRRVNEYLRQMGQSAVSKGGPGSGPRPGGGRPKKNIVTPEIKAMRIESFANAQNMGVYSWSKELKGTPTQHEDAARHNDALAAKYREIDNKTGESEANAWARMHREAANKISSKKVIKGGPGSGPQPGGGALKDLRERAKEARAKGDHKRADAIQQRAAQMAISALTAARKSYAQNFVAGAKEVLPNAYFRQLHDQARNSAGGKASGMARRAAASEDKLALMAHRQELQAQLAQVESELAKNAPLNQEITVDSHVLTAKQQKKRARLAARIASQALAAVAKAEWDESQHPRDENGRFGSGSGSNSDGAKKDPDGNPEGEHPHDTEMRLARARDAAADKALAAGDHELAGRHERAAAWHRGQALAAVAKSEWDESQHPRDENGRFGGGSGSNSDGAKKDPDGNPEGEHPHDTEMRLARARDAAADKALAAGDHELAARHERAAAWHRGQAMAAVAKAGTASQAGKELVTFSMPAKILKTAIADYKRIVHSVVYAPGDVDAHGDYMSADDIEKMAHDAMRSGIYVNHEHAGPPLEVDIVESYIAPQDFDLELQDGEPYHIPKGSYVMGMHVWGDEPWQKVLKGEYVGYSLEGTALRDLD